MTRLSLRNPLASLMLGIAALVFAWVVTPRMAVDTFPDLTPPVLVVGTLAPGLAAKDVEKTLTWRIEKYVSATPGVEHVQSESRNNLSIAYVWLQWGTDLNSAQTLVQQQVQFAMSAVPKSLGVIPPFVLQFDPTNAPVVQVTVSGGGLTGPQLYDYALNNVEPLLEGIPGVASASPNGGQQRQINIIVHRAEAQSRGVTAEEVAAAVAQSNALLPSGEFIASDFDANVYTDAVPRHVKQIGDAMVKLVHDHPVYIEDVAQVKDGGAAPTQTVSVNGDNAVYLNVLRIPGGNTIQIVDAVKKVVAGLKNLPHGMVIKPVFDQSTFVKTSYSGLKREVLQALVLISLVILVFLQSLRGTLIVAVAIPLSFAVTLVVLYATGQTLNSFTLGGLTLAMGRLVDDAVVVLESIHRHHRQGMTRYRAALEGTNAVALPVLASTLTTIAVLLPVLLLAGLAKKLFAPLALHVDTIREQAGFVDVTARDAAQVTLDGTLGNINAPSVWIDPNNGQAYYVVTYYDERDVQDMGALTQLPVHIAANAKPVTLGSYANIERAAGPIAIERDHMARVTEIYMATEGRDVGSAVTELEGKLAANPRTRNIKFRYVGEMELMKTTFAGLGVAIGLAVMVVFMLMTIQFKSLRLPFVMLFAIPVCLIGITIALMAADQGFSVTALMGVLMVIGIAVSNGILLVAEASVHLNKGETKEDAIVIAARIRFTPIVMTSLATVIGLLPTALGLEAGTEANQALALAVVGGLTSSTLLSLFLIPSMFTLLAKPIASAEEDLVAAPSSAEEYA